jgi:translation elongation factor EF-Tu-like GTPase
MSLFRFRIEVDKPFLMPVEDVSALRAGAVGTKLNDRSLRSVRSAIIGLSLTRKSVVAGIEMFNKTQVKARQAVTSDCC